ncbi:MAG TPA: hypothetical protein VMY05_12355 [Acidobacteriota bacterium]|nr:hypothetical protein [Acidobacteriota bacterium]
MARRTGNTVHDWLLVKPDPKKQIRDRYKRAKDALRTRRANWRKIRRAYHGYVTKTSGRRGRANFHFHKLFPQIELEAVRVITTYFQHTPFVAVSPTSGRSVEKAQRHEQVVQHYLEHAPTFFLEVCRLVKYSFLYGTGFMIPSWRRDVGKVHRKVPVVLSGQHVGTVDHEVDEVLYEGLWFKTFSPFDVFPAPFSSWISQAPWVIVVEFVPVGELVKRAEMKVYDKAKVMKVALNCHEQEEWEISCPFENADRIRQRRRILGAEYAA